MLNRNLETKTELQRTVLRVCHTKLTSWIVTMTNENRRGFDVYYFEVFNSSQYASDEHLATFSLPRDAIKIANGSITGQNCTVEFDTSGDGIMFRISPVFEPECIHCSMSKLWFL